MTDSATWHQQCICTVGGQFCLVKLCLSTMADLWLQIAISIAYKVTGWCSTTPNNSLRKNPTQIFLVRKKAGRWHHPLSSISILAFDVIISSLPPHKLGLITNSAQTPGSGYRWWWPWRIIPFSKWLVTMVIESPQHLGLFPFQMAEMAYKWGWS